MVFGHLYALSSNPETKFSDWVAYEVNPVNFGNSPGRHWAADPLLDERETLEASDYKSASKAIDIDRGHKAPLASFAGSRYWNELNYLSNITPQKKALNQGAWKNLEEAVRNASSYKRPLYVITGTWYDKGLEGPVQERQRALPRADESHVLPSAYYKIIYTSKGDAAVFYMPQDLPRRSSYCQQQQDMDFLQSKLNYQLPVAALHLSGDLGQQLGCP
jgi:endonuclease G